MGSMGYSPATAEVNNDYDVRIAGGFAPLPVSPFSALSEHNAGLY